MVVESKKEKTMKSFEIQTFNVMLRMLASESTTVYNSPGSDLLVSYAK